MAGWNRRLAAGARVLLGLVFVIFGVNYFAPFIPAPPMPESAIPFVMGLMGAHYLMPLLKTVEIVAGLLLLSGRAVPLALVVLAPIILNIVGFHTFLVPDPTMPVLLLTLELFLAWTWREAFAPLFGARLSVTGPTAEALASLSLAQTRTPAR